MLAGMCERCGEIEITDEMVSAGIRDARAIGYTATIFGGVG